jgi:hypothetical protein
LQSKPGRYALLTALILVLGIPAVAAATGEGRALLGGFRNPSSGSLARETQVIANNSTYGTRQSNKRSGDGGGAIYGCRSDIGNEACIRSNNLRAGRAFEFETLGKEAGAITVKDPAGVPFTTNATGVVKNLNADKLDGKDSTELASAGDLLFAAVNADGTLVTGSRGGTAAARTNAAEQTYTVTFNKDVSKCSYTANAVGASSAAALGVSSGATADPATTKPNTVLVDEQDVADGNTAGRGFHLQVIC